MFNHQHQLPYAYIQFNSTMKSRLKEKGHGSVEKGHKNYVVGICVFFFNLRQP